MSPQMGELTKEDVDALIAAHSADLDAHTRDHFEVLRVGGYYSCLTDKADSSIAITANQMYAVPFVAARAMTLDRIAVGIVVADPGKNARLGIYNDGANLYPGALVVDAGVISVAGAGIIAAVIAESIPRGLYWLVILSDGVPNMYFAEEGHAILGLSEGAALLRYACATWEVAQAYGALPDPFTAGGSRRTLRSPHISVRIGSLD